MPEIALPRFADVRSVNERGRVVERFCREEYFVKRASQWTS
jgi:hypothetical protein